MIHCAAISDTGACEREEEASWQVNVLGSDNEDGTYETVRFETILDYFYEIKDSLNMDDESWTSFRTMNKEAEFGCLRVLTVRCLERFCFGEKFDLHEVLKRCRNMCTQMAS